VALQGHEFLVLGEDGNPVWKTYRADDLVLPPGKRFDVLVRGGEVGTYRLKTLPFDEGFELLPQKTLARLPVTGAPQDDRLPSKPLELVPKQTTSLEHSPIAQKRTFRFSFATGKQGQFEAEINGQTFDPSKVDVVPVVNTVEQWRLVNHSNEDHPFHIHVNDFEVMSVNGHPYNAHGLQDVVIIPKNGGNVVIRNPFLDFTGEFVFHCHILGHEDAGMMQSVEVVGSRAEAKQTQQIDQGSAHSMPGHES
jgi:FtsP/CotA-like multicopper oxidase with cupredoxin domain